MKRKSHIAIGQFLLREYLTEVSPFSARLFLLGCIEPDENPSTYLKGSLRSAWMRGHNYPNASRFLLRLGKRLEGKAHFSPLDYYALGKLVHYTLDAFTYPHNSSFGGSLAQHREYEAQLQTAFLEALNHPPAPENCASFAALLRQEHDAYLRLPGDVETDVSYSLRVCCSAVKYLTGVGVRSR